MKLPNFNPLTQAVAIKSRQDVMPDDVTIDASKPVTITLQYTQTNGEPAPLQTHVCQNLMLASDVPGDARILVLSHGRVIDAIRLYAVLGEDMKQSLEALMVQEALTNNGGVKGELT